MKGLTVIVPFKGEGRKSRLAMAIGERHARRLASLMMEDVIGSVAGGAGMDSVCVVSSDSGALSYARKSGASVIKERGDVGVNVAVELAMSKAKNSDFLLVIPCDLPLLKGHEVRQVVSLLKAGFVVIGPSLSFDGTNALGFRRDSAPELSYDSDSFWNHLASAARDGNRVAVVTYPGVIFDVDSEKDLFGLANSKAPRKSVAYAKQVVES